MNNNFVVIMAGGIGSRFWPMSTSKHPKQFHDVLGIGKSLLQMTVERYLPICDEKNIYIVTNENYKGLVKEQLPNFSDDQILLEPSRKNTAPCIAYAAYKIHQQNPEAKMIVAPSDHLIMKEHEFQQTIKAALTAADTLGQLITIGIKPNRPDTGYGYIQFENGETNVRKVKTFTEKPSLDIAQRFIDSGDFYWNSGMFIWSSATIIDAFEKYLPEIGKLFNDIKDDFYSTEEEASINRIYPLCKNISIDYGIMEKAEHVSVILADLGWSDLGTWGSLYTHIEQDSNKNAIVGKNVLTYDANDNMIKVSDEKLVVIQGLNDFIVVENEKTLLICKKRDEQKIKQFVTDIKSKKGDQFI
ncbi:mannose-1-phosphate guanylyltransferase [Parvicella tangerina]|uniref:mannose-1-phosphate guanylyltransferase n=1 Tax=Parvicella tangerina TaxID=2829795 RepID=A0A916JNP8_9FLAO|nr:mannose-1-phosphate guanylyltransferase [Parvicella tangerina]CAG5084230.1 Alginate biosynthesis protein AlgA [Parvicella tangerina]